MSLKIQLYRKLASHRLRWLDIEKQTVCTVSLPVIKVNNQKLCKSRFQSFLLNFPGFIYIVPNILFSILASKNISKIFREIFKTGATFGLYFPPFNQTVPKVIYRNQTAVINSRPKLLEFLCNKFILEDRFFKLWLQYPWTVSNKANIYTSCT